MVQVQHAFALARLQALAERTGLAGLVARHRVVMRDLVAAAADDVVGSGALPVRGVGGEDAVLAVEDDIGLV